MWCQMFTSFDSLRGHLAALSLRHLCVCVWGSDIVETRVKKLDENKILRTFNILSTKSIFYSLVLSNNQLKSGDQNIGFLVQHLHFIFISPLSSASSSRCTSQKWWDPPLWLCPMWVPHHILSVSSNARGFSILVLSALLTDPSPFPTFSIIVILFFKLMFG